MLSWQMETAFFILFLLIAVGGGVPAVVMAWVMVFTTIRDEWRK